MPTALNPESQQYADRFYLGRSTATITDSGGAAWAVTRCVFHVADEELRPRLRNEYAARDWAIQFARSNFLRKFDRVTDPAWSAMDEFVLDIPEDERYW